MVEKAVILCGGQGTRFLPVTKALPKEMLPVVDTPVLDFIVREMLESGIRDICIVISPEKTEIVDYFTKNEALEKILEKKGDESRLNLVKSIGKGARFTFEVQYEAKGMADALMLARDFTDGKPFVLSTGDDLVSADVPVSKQLIDAFETGCLAVIGGQTVAKDKISLYGCAELGEQVGNDERARICRSIVEKPKPEDAPSSFASLGRYVFSSEIFDFIERITPAPNGELQVTDAINLLAKKGTVLAYDFAGKRYDMGNKTGAVKAVIDYALKNPETAEGVREYLRTIKL